MLVTLTVWFNNKILQVITNAVKHINDKTRYEQLTNSYQQLPKVTKSYNKLTTVI